MRDNVKVVAILNIVLGCFGVLAGIVVLVLFGGLATMAGLNNDRDAATAVPVLAAIGTGLAIFLFVLSVPSIIGGWGLLKFKPWARMLMIIISVLNLLHFPLGTALGIYGLIILLNDETRRLFESGGRYVPAPYPAYGQPGYPPPAAPGSYAPPPPPGPGA